MAGRLADLHVGRRFILDMDGVLYRGDTPAPGIESLFALLPQDRYVCVTNNSMLSAADCSDKLARMGVDVPPDRVVPVADALGTHLAETAQPGTPTFVIGEQPLHDAVEAAGMKRVDVAPQIIALGLDLDQRFEQLAVAVGALRAGARLVATSDDPILLTPDSAVPGTGAFVALLRACAAVEVELVGKPRSPMFRRALQLLGCDAAEAVVVGDSVTADIAGGWSIGAATVLLLSGVTTDAAGADPRPDHTFPDLAALVAHLRSTA
jgi:HAD superfamily hydrolase (TIGR01450 family)